MDCDKPAQRQVFSTPELFQSILLQMDLRTLLTSAQRVCKTWTSMIRESSPIQQKLFLTPIKARNIEHVEKRLNPLLAEVFPIFQPDHSTPSNKGEEDDNSDHKNDNVLFQEIDLFKNPRKKAAYIRPEASWRRMLIRQPPPTTMGLFLAITGGCTGARYHYETVKCLTTEPSKQGIRMETLFELLMFKDIWSSINQIYWRGESHVFCYRNGQPIPDLAHIEAPDIQVITHFHNTRPWSRRECECYPVINQIRDGYSQLGLEPKGLDEKEMWETTEWNGRRR